MSSRSGKTPRRKSERKSDVFKQPTSITVTDVTENNANLTTNIIPTKIKANKLEAAINEVKMSANMGMKRGVTVASINVDQGDTQFCVGCTIARHFVTFIFDTLKENNYKNYTIFRFCFITRSIT